MPSLPGQISFQISVQDLLIWIIVGLVAGFIAGRAILGPGVGVVAALVIGILGAIIGNFLAGYFGVQVSVADNHILSEIVIALFGALVLLVILRLFGLGRRRAVL
jgi:uncharacterized membrane protein YeaQ/YmgE (transglycosylase-associated protein family)